MLPVKKGDTVASIPSGRRYIVHRVQYRDDDLDRFRLREPMTGGILRHWYDETDFRDGRIRKVEANEAN